MHDLILVINAVLIIDLAQQKILNTSCCAHNIGICLDKTIKLMQFSAYAICLH